MLRRFLLLPSLTVLSGIISVASAAGFSDTAGTRYDEAVSHLAGRGVVSGFADGSGRPFDLLTRAQAIKVLVSLRPELLARARAHALRMPPIPLFVDVSQDHWYAPYVEAAFEAGFVRGFPDRSLRPEVPLAVSDAIAMLAHAQGFTPLSPEFRTSVAIENGEHQWYTPFVNAVLERNLISGNERMEIGAAITRGQFFDMVYRADVVRRENLTAFNRPEPVGVATRPQPVARASNLATTRRPPAAGPSVVSNPNPSPHSIGAGFSITIPSLGIHNLRVSHPPDLSPKGMLSVLQHGVGHLFGYPGSGSKILIYGHSSDYAWNPTTYAKIFRQINRLKPGDRVEVAYGGTLHVYQISHSKTVPARDMSSYRGGNREELILYTCWPPDNITQRFLQFAYPVEQIVMQ